MIANGTCVEARATTEHPSVHRLATLTTKNYLVQNINSAKVEKPWTHLVSAQSQEAPTEKGASFGSSVH